MSMYENLDELIKVSGEKVMKTKPIQDILKSPNALAFYKWYKKEIEWANLQIDSVENILGIKNSCYKGCSSCCKQPIGIVPIEMLAIQQFVKNLRRQERKKLYDHTLDICNKISESGIQTNINLFRSENSIQEYMKQYYALGINCPLLSNNNTCLIYEIRPVNCWSYRVYGDPKDCELLHNPDHGIQFSDWETLILKRMLEVRTRKKDTVRLLPFALKNILEDFI